MAITPVAEFLWIDEAPNYCEPKAQQAVDIARTYWIARARGRSFTYSKGDTFLDNYTVNNSSKQGKIDCSTFIHLVLRGISYNDSPYYTETANYSFNPTNLVTNNSEYDWADDGLEYCDSIGKRVRYAADFAAYYWMQGRCFSDSSLLKPGDLVFCASGAINDRFMNVTHVGIMTEDLTQFFNVTDSSNVVVRSFLTSRSDIVFFARPDYENLAKQTYSFNSEFNYLASPWINKTTTINGITYTVNEEDESIVSSGSATNGSQFNLSTEAYPLYLPAGTYELTGAPGRLDRGSRVDYSYWGLRLYPYDGRTITSTVKGFTSTNYSASSITSVTQSNNVVWDKGYGATFTIDTPMAFHANIYISKNVIASSVYTGPDSWYPSLKRIA